MATTMTAGGCVGEMIGAIEAAHPHEPEFLQAVREVGSSLEPVFEQHPEYRHARIFERVVEPERVIGFRITWLDDKQVVHVNRGYRVQFSSTLGPYKGGLRFHPSVNLSILKFLGFEQIFKNSLTGLPIGGGKGGSDFDPKGRSDSEVMTFCQAFMTELFRHIGPNTDVPAGDIGVGGREVGYLFGQYKRLANEFTGTLTGKGRAWGGSLIRPEATGYGAVYFGAAMLGVDRDDYQGKRCLVSGSGNVAQYTIEKLIALGATVVSASDSGGFIYDADGIDRKKLEWIQELKNVRRGRIAEYVNAFPKATYTATKAGADHNPLWANEADCAFPCATQNEINGTDAANLIGGGVKIVVEGANMPTTPAGIDAFADAGVKYAPGKASNAGGVAVSALEMSQNSLRLSWSREEVDEKLQNIMRSIHDRAREAAESYGFAGNYMHGANIAGFRKVADAMMDQGLV